MTLHAYSARINSADPDRLDVTRKSGTAGLPFAPSWDILAPALRARRTDGASTELYWPRFAERYRAEMRVSYRAQRPAWDALLAQGRVVLVCYCVDAEHCHRALLRGILAKLGARDGGELR